MCEMNGLAIVFCYFLLISQPRIQVLSFPKITNPPVSMTAFLDTWVSFHCEGEGDILVWQTNGVLLSDEIKQTRNISIHPGITIPGIVNSTLVILAKPENDGLNIGCIVGLLGSFMFDSLGADLFVRAIGPVEELFFNVSMNEYAIVVWNPPSFVANDVNLLAYRVVVIDDNDNALVDIVTIAWEYEISIDILSLCSIYTVIVTAYDNLYTSDSSIIQEEYIREYSASIVEDNISVEETGNFTVQFTIKLEGNPRLCNSVIRGYTQIDEPVGNYHKRKHNPESIETNNDTYIAKYTVTNFDQQLNYRFDCQIEDTLNNIKDTVHQKFTTNHVQDFTAHVHENGSIYVQCIFANNSNASGCGLNFTEREDTTVTLYSVHINNIQGSVEASGYINLPVSGNLTVIAFDILNDEVSDKVAVIYNGLAEIKIVTAMPNQTSIFITTSTPNSIHFSSSSMYLIQTTVVAYHEVSSSPTTEVSSIPKSTAIVSNVGVITISTVTVFIFIVMIIVLCVIIGIVKKIRRSRQNNINGVCEDDINRNPAYEQVMLQRVVLSENQAYASIRNEREHNSTIRIYENVQMHS